MIKDIVNGLFETCGTTNLIDICAYLDIKIMYSDLGNELKGFFQRTPNGYEIIHINNNLSEQEQRYICAHELGHAIMHPDLSISFSIENPLLIKNKFEIEADKFAAYLLINDFEKEYIGSMNTQQLSAYFYVPERLITYRFNSQRS